MREALAAALLLAAGTAAAAAGEIPRAVLVLEATAGTPGSDPVGAPPRFVLLQDGQVFVGGSASVEAGLLEKNEAQELRKRAAALRRLAGIGAPIAFGEPADLVFRLRVLEGQPLEVVASGDPGAAPAALSSLASLLRDLARFHHPSLRPYAPDRFALVVREARLAGGCRPWPFAFPVAEALGSSRAVAAVDVADWPTGALPASVCVGDRRYGMTLRPLLPDEQP